MRWNKLCMDKAVEDIFGYNAIQLGLASLQALENSRIPNRWLALNEPSASSLSGINPHLFTKFDALPFPEQSIDLVILPHTLDLASDPHATLREVARILVPEGKVVITGINPTSLWGLLQKRIYFAQRLGEKIDFLPLERGNLIRYWRLRDWLRLLNLDIVAGHFGCYRPAFKTQKWLDRAAWMEHAGDRWWPILGATYHITAVKHICAGHRIDPLWKKNKKRNKISTVTAQNTKHTHKNSNERK